MRELIDICFFSDYIQRKISFRFGHQEPIQAIDALMKERCVTAGGRDGSLRLWKIVEESHLVFTGPK